MNTGIIIVDHGSRRTESNSLLENVARAFGARFSGRYPVVEPAHMELAEPSIATAYAACVSRGASRVVVAPFFLGPGKHWTDDIPRLTADAAARFPDTRYHVAAPLGLDDLILDLLAKRLDWCQEHALSCDSCAGTIRCGDGSPINADALAVASAATPNSTCSSCPFFQRPDGTIIDRRQAAPST